MTIPLPFFYDSFVNFHDKIIWETQHDRAVSTGASPALQYAIDDNILK